MENLEKHLHDLIKTLKQERDELKVRMHLAKLELGDEWDNLNDRINSLEVKAKELSGVGSEASKNIVAAAKLLGEEIRDGFKKIAKRL